MIDVRKAVLAAQSQFQDMQDLMSQNGSCIHDLRLEEVEISEDKKYWFVTLGYNFADPEFKNVPSIIFSPPKSERNYKIFKINSETGEFESMKIREV